MDGATAPGPATAPQTNASPRRATRTSSSVTFSGLTRRRSSSERINEILQTARERAEAMTASPHRGRSTNGTAPDHESADEHTGMVSGTGRTYDTIQPSPAPAGSGPRSRKRRTDHRESSGQEIVPTAAGYSQEEPEGSAQRRYWYEKALEPFQSIELENKGSVARDHLAIERTFLAWLRTSLAFASIGIAVTQLFRLNLSLKDSAGNDVGLKTLRHLGRPLGASFLAISVLILFLGYRRYSESQQWVIKGKFPASRGTIIVVSLVAFALIIASLIVVVVVHPTGSTGP